MRKELITSQMAAALHVWKDKWKMSTLIWIGQSCVFLLIPENLKPHLSPESLPLGVEK